MISSQSLWIFDNGFLITFHWIRNGIRLYKEASFHYSMAIRRKAYRNFPQKVFEIIQFESFGTIETSKGFQHKVHERISKGIVLVTGPFYGVKHAFITCLTHNN